MSRLFPLTLAALALLASACSNPRCPRRFIQRGNTCSCPPGTKAKGDDCVALDGGDIAEPDQDAGEIDIEDEDGSASSDATARDAQSTSDAEQGGGADAGSDAANADAIAPTDDAAQTLDASTPLSDAAPDAAEAGPPCYADKDKDGVGAGVAVSCEGYGTDAGAGLSMTNNDCDDNNDKRSPSLTDVCGDNIDNDCDGTPDDESNNACGGPCTVQLAHQPGEKCDNGSKGECYRDGKYVCNAAKATACDAPVVAAADERCGDQADNDCDGASDESDAVDAKTWYPDCDADGYSALSETLIAAKVGYVVACQRPVGSPSCPEWTTLAPVGAASRDCDDLSSTYRPGAEFGIPPVGRSSTDLNCDGSSEKEPAITVCGFGCGGMIPQKVCSTSASCEACASLGGSGQWLLEDKKTPTDTAPACSTGMSDTHPWRSIEWPNGIGVCASNQYNSSYYGGWQRCR